MKPVYLQMENFLCYEKTDVNLSAITTALIIGKLDGNDNVSNSTGKSTIFRAIEYVLFNEARDLNLEEIIRDDTNACKVIFDFALGNKIWRISRSRTRKGTADLSLYERTDHEEAGVDPHCMTEATDSKFKLFWLEKSSRRAADTEADLEKLIKTNYKAFSSAFLFAQNDFNSGLANITASKRRAFFKESLPIGVYSKLEKLAKEKSSLIVRELDKKKAVRDNYPDLDADNVKLNAQKNLNVSLVLTKQFKIEEQEKEVLFLRENASKLNNQYTTLRAQISSVLEKRKSSEDRVKRLEATLLGATFKRKDIIAQAKDLNEQLKKLKEDEVTASANIKGLAIPEKITSRLEERRSWLAESNAEINNLRANIAELEIPLSSDAVCKHCRQPSTDAHRRAREIEIKKEILEKKKSLDKAFEGVKTQVAFLKAMEDTLKEIQSKHKNLEIIKNSLVSKEREIFDKKAIFDDHSKIIDHQKEEHQVAIQELDAAKKEAEQANEQKLIELRDSLNVSVSLLKSAEKILGSFNQELNDVRTEISIIENNIKKNEDTRIQKNDLLKSIISLEEDYSIYPDIIQAYGSTGIPNLIIQSLLDDLQIEANKILSKIKPSLQLEFSVTKTNAAGEINDDLDIKYYHNNKLRSFGAISGSLKLSVMFALKLGYAFLLYNTLGTDIKLLMLDEVDMPLDKESIDALADIIKHFQDDFTIMIISHNDRSKEKLEKFSKVICVEQSQNMTSKIKILS